MRPLRWFTPKKHDLLGMLEAQAAVTLEGIEGWNPEPPEPAFPREEVEAEFLKYRERGSLAVATGDWVQWADQFTDDAEYREHHYGYFKGRQAITDWITGVMKPFPTMEFPVKWALIVGTPLWPWSYLRPTRRQVCENSFTVSGRSMWLRSRHQTEHLCG